MELFLDTNVLLGYTFKIDSWNSQSLFVIESGFEKCSSNNVKREFKKIYNEKNTLANKDLTEILIKLSRKKSIDNKKLMNILNDHYLKPSIESLWDAGLSTINKDTLMRDIREIKRICDLEIRNNKLTLEKCICFYDRGGEKYEEIYQKLLKTGLMFVNPADGYIVLDAHHVGLIKNNLHFVTGDKNDIVNRKSSIIDSTSIKNIIYLAEFSDFCKDVTS